MISITDVVIDQELRDLIPKLSSDELSGLTESVVKDGFTDPLIVWLGHGILVDGHNRYQIWTGALNSDEDKAPEIIEKAFADRDEVKEFMLRRQLSRRNLTDAARIQIALKLKPFIEAKAKAKESQRKSTSSTLPKSLPVIDTRKELATTAGVSEGTFRKAEAVLKSDNVEAKQEMLAGTKSINKAFQEVSSTGSTAPTPVNEASSSAVAEAKPAKIAPHSVKSDVAKSCIALLKGIPKKDPSRLQAFDDVVWWIKANRNK